MDAREALNWFPRHSHNAYLQVVVDLGIVGLAIVVTIGLWALVRTAWLVARTGRAEYSALAALLVAIMVHGITESAFVMPRDMGLISAVIVFSLVVARQGAKASLPQAARRPALCASRRLAPLPVRAK